MVNNPKTELIEISFNLILVEKTINEELKIEDIWLQSGSDTPIQPQLEYTSIFFDDKQIFSTELKFLGTSI